MSIELIARLIGMTVLGIGGFYLGVELGNMSDGLPSLWAGVFTLMGILTGIVVTPYVSTRPLRAIRRRVALLTPQTMFAGLAGMVVGLTVAALVSFPFSLLPSPFGQLLPFVGAVVFGYLGVSLFIMRQNDLMGLLRNRFSSTPGEVGAADQAGRKVLLDTSVIIDGRIADIALSGFISGPMLVPSFVLNELQHIADSSDNLRRQRGRRGLDILNRLRKDSRVPLNITDLDVEGVRNVDDKLVILAKQLRCPIATNDYNLNRVAELQGVTVLNINELANAVKAIFLPGESMEVQLIQEGKEERQGVGYLDDGTMVVVENGKDFLDQTVPVLVTKVLQTAAGRMIFAKPDSQSKRRRRKE